MRGHGKGNGQGSPASLAAALGAAYREQRGGEERAAQNEPARRVPVLRIGVDTESGEVVLDFGTQIQWVRFSAEEAEAVAQHLVQHAKQARARAKARRQLLRREGAEDHGAHGEQAEAEPEGGLDDAQG